MKTIQDFWNSEKQDLYENWESLIQGVYEVPAGIQVQVYHPDGDFIAVGKNHEEAVRNIRARIVRRLANLPE